MNSAFENYKNSYNNHTSPLKRSKYWGKYTQKRFEIIADKPVSFSRDKAFILKSYTISEHGKALSDIHKRIVYISDLHWNGKQSQRYNDLVLAINALEADWIIFGGDLCVFMDTVDEAISCLAKLKAKCGKIAVRGNRESPIFWLSENDWAEIYNKAGFTLLCNQLLQSESINFYGVDDIRYGSVSWDAIKKEDKTTVTISHNPDAIADAAEESYIGDIALCGHTHGGQICLPLFGPVYTSSAYGRQFLNGWKERSDGTLCHISTGIGESGFGLIRRRLLCPREVLMLTI